MSSADASEPDGPRSFFARRRQPMDDDDPLTDPHSRWVDRFGLLLLLVALTVALLAYYYAFLTVDSLAPVHFFGAEQSTTSFMYVSLTTITTVGYGDLAAVSPVGRLLATSEAIIGQVYLVVFVALIVSMAAGRWQRTLD